MHLLVKRRIDEVSCGLIMIHRPPAPLDAPRGWVQAAGEEAERRPHCVSGVRRMGHGRHHPRGRAVRRAAAPADRHGLGGASRSRSCAIPVEDLGDVPELEGYAQASRAAFLVKQAGAVGRYDVAGARGGVIAHLVLAHLHGHRRLKHTELPPNPQHSSGRAFSVSSRPFTILRSASGLENGSSRRSDMLP